MNSFNHHVLSVSWLFLAFCISFRIYLKFLLSKYLLLVCRNSMHLCILTLYSVTWLYSLIHPNVLCTDFCISYINNPEFSSDYYPSTSFLGCFPSAISPFQHKWWIVTNLASLMSRGQFSTFLQVRYVLREFLEMTPYQNKELPSCAYFAKVF